MLSIPANQSQESDGIESATQELITILHMDPNGRDPEALHRWIDSGLLRQALFL